MFQFVYWNEIFQYLPISTYNFRIIIYIYIYIFCKVHTCRLATKNNCNNLELALSRLNYIRWYFIKTSQVQNSGRLKNTEKRQLNDCIFTAAWQVENHLSWLIELYVFTDWDIDKVGKQLIFSTVGSRIWGNSCTYKYKS